MHAYLLAPLAACLVSVVCATLILSRDATHGTNRLAAFIALGCTWWSACEILWNTAEDPGVVLALVRLSALGWIGIGPTFLHLMLRATSAPAPQVRRLSRIFYPTAAVMLALAWTTPLLTRSVVRESWGWAYEPGPLMPGFYAVTVASVFVAFLVGRRAFRQSRSPGERAQARLLVTGIFVPVCVASVTDAILPMLGIQWPRFGTLSVAWLCAVIAWSSQRYGYSVLAPGRFQKEVFEVLPEGVAILHLDGSVRTGNGSLAGLCAASLEDLAGTSMQERLGIPLDGAAELREHECELRTEGGDRVPVAVSTAPLQDKRGSLVATLLVVRDLREVAGLRRRLATRDRLAAVGQLAAGIAHEVNNPLAYARANLNMLRVDWEKRLSPGVAAGTESPLDEGAEVLDEALDGVDRAIAIMREVTRFSRGGDESRSRCELGALLESSLRFARPQIGVSVQVELSRAELPPVLVAARELEQVFLNLILNAGQALGSTGRIRIETSRRGDLAVVSIEDDGPGIPAEMLGRIFDPFFSTKPVGQGTGLGLAVSHEIVRRHGGELRVESRIGEGTRFEVSLPLDPDGDADPD